MSAKALLCVDLQNDFYEDGALGVPEASEINPHINRLLQRDDYRIIVASQDWHPSDHLSFAVNHEEEPFTPYEGEDEGLGPVLWPVHCEQGSRGAEFHEDIDTDRFDVIVRKGQLAEVDSYSAFQDNNGRDLGLAGLLKGLKIKSIDIVGLALDVCVLYTARDAREHGFEVNLIRPATRGVNASPGDVENALAGMKEKGGEIIRDY